MIPISEDLLRPIKPYSLKASPDGDLSHDDDDV